MIWVKPLRANYLVSNKNGYLNVPQKGQMYLHVVNKEKPL